MIFLPQRNPNAVSVARFGKQLQVRANGTFAMGPNLEPRVAMVDERERRCGGSPDTTALELGASGNIRPKKKHRSSYRLHGEDLPRWTNRLAAKTVVGESDLRVWRSVR
ncbi:hypothetical protein E4U56_001679 [Claviceps arundinis]|uniref:Uncharacterized protein n=1 Tax=Claviceps arundinis TaxID=1623583 RepID=A0A9P7SS76_9HYPO|nr:hypothetical protein E4U56_001679 [Claviceps arundinis]